MKKGGYAYHTYQYLVYEFIDRTFNNREVCELTEVHLLLPTFTYFGTNYNGSFVELSKRGYIF